MALAHPFKLTIKPITQAKDNSVWQMLMDENDGSVFFTDLEIEKFVYKIRAASKLEAASMASNQLNSQLSVLESRFPKCAPAITARRRY